jgi:site-specific DNA-methyltransferase (adenine-specific)
VTAPYYADDLVTLYLGDCREVLPALGVQADCVVADPPYGETSLAWDRWPDGWLDAATTVTRSLWCFGSLRMYLERASEFQAAWKLSQDIIWEKHMQSGRAADRFRNVHEQPTHWYRGRWDGIYHEPPRIKVSYRTESAGGSGQPYHTGAYGSTKWTDDGTRIMPSVIKARSLQHGHAIQRTEKPPGILAPLIEYACPPGGLVVAPFAGSGSDLDAARQSGRRAIGVELHEPHAEQAARRLCQGRAGGGGVRDDGDAGGAGAACGAVAGDGAGGRVRHDRRRAARRGR